MSLNESDTLPDNLVADSTMPHKEGELKKLSKSGNWQKRYFATHACFLTYYKTSKMKKLLAAVNLPQVGTIALRDADEERDWDPQTLEDGGKGLFSIQLNSREYILKASSDEEAREWVNVLNALKQNDKKEKEAPAQGYSSAKFDTEVAPKLNDGGVVKNSRAGFLALCCGPCSQLAFSEADLESNASGPRV